MGKELTTRGINALAIPDPEDGPRDYPDGRIPGLALRVFTSGRRTWSVKYWQNGRQRRFKLGDYPFLSLAAVRKAAEAFRVRVRAGYDPVRAREEGQNATLLGELFETYLEEHARRSLAPRTVAESERILMGRDLKRLRSLPAADVTEVDIARALDRIEARHAHTMLNRTQTAISAVYSWAVPRRRAGVISNPARALPRRYNERGRSKRHLTAEEIADVFGTIHDTPGVPTWAAVALWLVLITGQRPGEVLQARWEHIDRSSRTWRMPKGYRKRVRGQREAPSHDVSLSDLALEELDILGPRKFGHLFPSAGKVGHKNTNDLNQRVQRGLLKNRSMPGFTPHDLRRTCRTHLARLGVPRHIAEMILGHVDNSVAGIYDRHSYFDERRTALDQWSEFLEQTAAAGR